MSYACPIGEIFRRYFVSPLEIYLILQKLFHQPRYILDVPWTFIWAHRNLLGCADYYLGAQKFIWVRRNSFRCAEIHLDAQTFRYQPWIFLYWPASILLFPQKIIQCAKIFSNPQKYLVSPWKLLCFMRRFFASFHFWIAGLPWLCKWSIDGIFGTVVGV